MATIEVDIDQFNDEEILEELKARISDRKRKTNVQRLELRNKIKDILNIDLECERKYSLLDTMKLDLFLKNIEKVSLDDLEKLVV